MNTFLKPLVDQMKSLEKGLKFYEFTNAGVELKLNNGSKITVYVRLFPGNVDSMARAPIQGVLCYTTVRWEVVICVMPSR
jgi:hypothetical protein